MRVTLAVWEKEEREAYDLIKAGAPVDLVDADVLRQLEHGGFVIREGVDELSALQRAHDVERQRREVRASRSAPIRALREVVASLPRWTPFMSETCRSCKLLPSCAGAGAHRPVHASVPRGDDADLPCPSWKFEIKERLLHRATRVGAITADDYDPEDARTASSDLITDGHADSGQARTEETHHLSEEQKKLRRLPVVTTPSSR
jgi:hypothetical protein